MLSRSVRIGLAGTIIRLVDACASIIRLGCGSTIILGARPSRLRCYARSG
jgi:hypothetical protein